MRHANDATERSETSLEDRVRVSKIDLEDLDPIQAMQEQEQSLRKM
jgi:hypothetical protein